MFKNYVYLPLKFLGIEVSAKHVTSLRLRLRLECEGVDNQVPLNIVGMTWDMRRTCLEDDTFPSRREQRLQSTFYAVSH